MLVNKRLMTIILAILLIITMVPLREAPVVCAAQSAPGGIVTVDTTSEARQSAMTAFNLAQEDVSVDDQTLIIRMKENIELSRPVRFVYGGSAGKKVVLDLAGYEITGRAGMESADYAESRGGNAIEIAADAFDVEIKGPGQVSGGKGAQYIGGDYRYGSDGGNAVFFCERVDKLHGVTSEYGDVIDEGYRPDKLEYGLTVTGGASLVGGAGADADYDDWHSNACGELGSVLFLAAAGSGGSGIGQIFTGTEADDSLEELSYAKIVIQDGNVSGGAGGNVDTGDQLFTRNEIQKIDAVVQYMQDKEEGFDFDSHVTDNISFTPGDGGDGIEFHAGRKYILVGSGSQVSGGIGGMTKCSEKASMVKKTPTKCGDGGRGIYVCGDTGLTNSQVSLSDEASDHDFWTNKSADSDDVGICIQGVVKGGDSPDTGLLNDASGNGGRGIDCDLDGSRNLCATYNGATFDANHGILLVDSGGKVIGGDSGSPDGRTMSGGAGADAITGGSTGSPVSSKPRMTAGHFIIRGEAAGGYGSSVGGSGINMTDEREYIEQGNSAYFVGYIYGDGLVKGGDSGKWPHLEENSSYTTDVTGNICQNGELVCANGIYNKYENHPGSLSVSSTIREETGKPAQIMEEDSTFKVKAEMTPINEKPDAETRLRCTVTPPSGYQGKIYIEWTSEIDVSNPRSIYDIEGADGAYNDFCLPGDSDYPYGIKEEFYGKNYTIDIATYDRMAQRVQYNSEIHIFCRAILEDGRYADGNEIWFSRTGRSQEGWINGGGGEDPQPEDPDPQPENPDPQPVKTVLTAKMVSVSNVTYNKKAQKPAVRVKYDGKNLVNGKDFTVTYSNNVNAGKGKVTVRAKAGSNYTGTVSKYFTIKKAPNSLKVREKTASVKQKKLRKKSQILSAAKVIAITKKGKGKMTFVKVSGSKIISINKKTGKVTVKKGTKKGLYKAKIKVRAQGTSNYMASGWKTVTVSIKISAK